MPLSEFHQTKGKIETEQRKMTNYSSGRSLVMPDQDFVELLWENGPMVMQGQSSRPKKSTFTTLSPHASKFQGKDSTDAVIPKIGHFGEMDSNDFAPSVPSAPFGMNAQADDANPWMDYPIDDPLQNDYCSDFLSEFTSVHLNSRSLNSTTVPADRSNGFCHSVRNSENASEARVRTGQLFQLPQQCHSSATTTKSRTVEFGTSTLKSPSRNLLGRSSLKLDPEASKPLPPPPSSGAGLINFSHFSRPFTRVRSNFQSSDRIRSQEKASTAASSNPMESTRINYSSGVKSSSVVQGQTASVLTKMDVRTSAKSPPELVTGDIHQEEIPRDRYNDDVANVTTQAPYPANCHSSSVIASVTLARNEADNGPEAAVAASSVCSVNSVGEESNDPKNMLKRKNRDGEESGYHSEDLEDESVGLKKPSTARTMNAKRSRAAEVHNMSERRRRDRINEKMRALQELIPNCNKVDKASMLDEAIEYLKTLQLQVQIMSMGNGLCMPQMMLPPGMQQLHPPPMAHFPPMGLNMGMGMGIGMGYGMGSLDMNASPCCPMIPLPPMHGQQFPCHSIPLARPVVHGLHQSVSTNLQMYGIPGQGLPVSMARTMPYGNGNLMPATTPRPAVDTAPASDSKDLEQHNI